MEEIVKTKDKIKKIFESKYALTALYASINLLYLVFLNIVNASTIQSNMEIISIAMLLVSIIVMEISYKKAGKDFFVSIEILIISIYTLLINYISKRWQIDIQSIIKIGTISVILYYFFKMSIILTIKHKEHLNSLSDIKQIIKEEPIKKETKRKNIKE